MKYFLPLLAYLALTGSCFGEIITVSPKTTNLLTSYDQNLAVPVLEVPRYYPLSIQRTEGEFFRVSDYGGREGWIHKSLTSKQKGVVIKVKQANLREGPGEEFPVAMYGYRGVAFKVTEEKNGWLKVQHEGGQGGWIFKSLTWGL